MAAGSDARAEAYRRAFGVPSGPAVRPAPSRPVSLQPRTLGQPSRLQQRPLLAPVQGPPVPKSREQRGRSAAERDNDRLIPGMGSRDTKKGQRENEPPPKPRPRRNSNEELERSGISTSSPMFGISRPAKPPATEYERAQLAKQGKPVPGVPTRKKGGDEVPEWMKRRAIAYNTHMRRELSDDEFAALTPAQREQVRLNTMLTQAYDSDMAASPKGRSATRDVIKQLDLGDDLTKKLTANLGLGMGPTVRIGELTGTGATPIAEATDSRQKMVNDLAGKLSTFISQRDAADTESLIGPALARKDEFKFADEQTKIDFETSFDFLLDPQGRASLDWGTAQRGLQDIGINPADFKEYALNRLAMLPKTAGATTEINAWFGA